MKHYFNHSAYVRWIRQYQVTLDQIRTQFDALRLSVETIPFAEPVRHLFEEEIDEIDVQIEKLLPRNFVPGAMPLETREVFVENLKLMANFFCSLFHSSFTFKSIYENEKKRILKNYKDSNIKGKLTNFRRHIDEAIIAQMKAYNEAAQEEEYETEAEEDKQKEATG